MDMSKKNKQRTCDGLNPSFCTLQRNRRHFSEVTTARSDNLVIDMSQIIRLGFTLVPRGTELTKQLMAPPGLAGSRVEYFM